MADSLNAVHNIFRRFAVMKNDGKIEFARQKELTTQNLLLLGFVSLVPIIIQTNFSDSNQFVPMRTNGALNYCQLLLPIGLHVFRMQT